MAKISYEKLSYELANQLQPRVKDVVVARFGLKSQTPLTLEAVGRQHGITRERVRQIVQEGLVGLQKNMSARQDVAAAFAALKEALRRQGGMKREDLLLQALKAEKEKNHILFFLNLGEQFYNQRETQEFRSFWALKKDLVQKAVPLHQRLLSFFHKKKTPVAEHELQGMHGNDIVLYLESSKAIAQSPEGTWGLRRWSDVNPRGMRDKAYLVLRQEKRPLHFIDVANLIVKLQDNLPLQKKKTVLPQTVHNELIKDPRFVLVGRGTYGLESWGLHKGTLKDVMRTILASNGKTMKREKLIEEILHQRQVKESTISLNLQDRRYFLKNQDGTYSLKV